MKTHSKYMRSTAECSSLLDNYIYATIDEYIKDVKMDTAGIWGTTAEILTLAHMLGVNVVSYNADDSAYQLYSPGVIDFEAYGEDYSWPTMYIVFVHGNHFNVMLSQE